MLKWLRKYNTMILAVGGSILMVAFLITGPMLEMVRPDPTRDVVGRVRGVRVLRGDVNMASQRLAILARISPLLQMLSPSDPLQWVLMQHEAGELGLSASNYEVSEVVAMVGLDDPAVARLALSLQLPSEEIYESIRQWIALQHYRELMLGSAHVSLTSRLTHIGLVMQQVSQLSQMPAQFRNYYMEMLSQELGRQSLGQPRLSESLLKRFIADQQSTVSAGIVEVSADRYLDRIAPPTEADLVELFNAHRESLPGESEPYGFGYKLPDRVKIEYLSLPFDRVVRVASVSESDAIAYYDRNPDEFKAAAPAVTEPSADGETPVTPVTPAPTVTKPYEDVRSQIMDRLRREAATELADRIIKTAAAQLLEDARRLPSALGYRQIPPEWTPISLEQVAEAIQKQFNVLPNVVRREDRWLDAMALAELPGIGQSMVTTRAGIPFAAYVLSARELSPAEENPALPLRLQVGMPSQPVRSFDGSHHLFRILQAAPLRVPGSIDEVRAAVEHDARKLAAYRLAVADREAWVTRLGEDALSVIAQDLSQVVHDAEPFPRRAVTMGRVETPWVTPVGANQDFVDAVFDFAESIADNADFARMSPERRTTVIPSPAKLAIYLVRVDEYRRIPESNYRQIAQAPQVPSWIQQELFGSDMEDPFSLEQLKKRLGYVDENAEEV